MFKRFKDKIIATFLIECRKICDAQITDIDKSRGTNGSALRQVKRSLIRDIETIELLWYYKFQKEMPEHKEYDE